MDVSKRNLKLRRMLSKRFGWRCWYCGIKLSVDGGHLDHITPKSRGGTDKDDNFAIACEFCNYAKHDHSLDVFMSWLEWVRSGGSFTPYNLTPAEVCDAAYKSKLR
jgi:5-methylcytosine-specific restriction endonuclease McrA